LLLCSEPTYEGLVRLLRDGYGFAGLFTSEGGQFMGSHAMSPDNRLRTVTGLCKIFDGLPIDRVRAGDGISSLYERRAALHLLLQPIIANQIFGDELLIGQGFLSRILSVMPESAAGSRPFCKPAPSTISSLNKFANGLLALLNKKPPPLTARDREIKSKTLRLSAGAEKAWIDYYNGVESQVGAGSWLAPVRGLANKAPEHATRLAATLEGFKNPDANEVSKSLFDTATELVDFYLNDALRIYATIQDSADLKLADLTLEWLTKQWPEPAFSLRDIYQFGPYAIRDAETAKRVVVILVEHGHITQIEGGAVIRGIKRRQAYKLVCSSDLNLRVSDTANPANPANFPNDAPDPKKETSHATVSLAKTTNPVDGVPGEEPEISRGSANFADGAPALAQNSSSPDQKISNPEQKISNEAANFADQGQHVGSITTNIANLADTVVRPDSKISRISRISSIGHPENQKIGTSEGDGADDEGEIPGLDDEEESHS
jgi:hypothetical protein